MGYPLAMAAERISNYIKARSGGIVSPVFSDLLLGRDGFPCSDPHRYNGVLFFGDHVKKIDRLLNPSVQQLAGIGDVGPLIARKLGPGADVWIIDAPRFAWRSMACYDGYLPWINQWGTPHGYDPRNLPAATTTLNVLKDTVYQVHENLGDAGCKAGVSKSSSSPPCRTIVMGFSKGGVVLNQLITELAHVYQPDYAPAAAQGSPCGREFVSIPSSREEFLRSIEQIHYVDVGMNECGAYLTDGAVLEQLAKAARVKPGGLAVFMHGTPRQWCDPARGWIGAEKDQCVRLLRAAGERFSEGKLQVEEKMYFEGDEGSLDMHFAILEAFEISLPS